MNFEGPVTNFGTINWASGTQTIYNNLGIYSGLWNNQASGVLNIQGDFVLSCACYGSEYIRNAGTIHKLAGLGVCTISVAATNTGTIDCQSGTLRFSGGGSFSGTYNVAAGAIIEFNAGTYTQTGPVTVSGDGIFRQNGATIKLLDRIIKFSLLSGNVALLPAFEGSGAGRLCSLTALTLPARTW